MATTRLVSPTPSFPLRSLQDLHRTIPHHPDFRLATRLHSTTMPITHRRDARGSSFAVLRVFDVFLLFRVRPRDDEAPEVLEEPGTTGDRDEPAEFSRDDALNAPVVRGGGSGLYEAV